MACVAALVVALKRTSGVPLPVPLVAAGPVFWGVFAIYDIEVRDKPLPKMTDVRFGARSCASPCPGGFPVSFAPRRSCTDPGRPDAALRGRRQQDLRGLPGEGGAALALRTLTT